MHGEGMPASLSASNAPAHSINQTRHRHSEPNLQQNGGVRQVWLHLLALAIFLTAQTGSETWADISLRPRSNPHYKNQV